MTFEPIDPCALFKQGNGVAALYALCYRLRGSARGLRGKDGKVIKDNGRIRGVAIVNMQTMLDRTVCFHRMLDWQKYVRVFELGKIRNGHLCMSILRTWPRLSVL